MRNQLLALVLAFPCVATAQESPVQALPIDSAVTMGRLDNGLTYYIRENHQPANRAELRLVVNAGSVLEDDDQRGVAHFVEHMAFNGTRHFEKQSIIDFIERIGMRFGADLNAYTSFDETVYMLTVPTDSAPVIEQALQVLEDWAHGVTFDTTEIRKERGVVIEEWRLGQGASARMRNQTFPVLFRGSQYAERLPIGTKESLETFNPDVVRRYYRDWYRPDLMAVIAVGDFDKVEIERLIRTNFGSIAARKNARPRPQHTPPQRALAAAVIATDPEATGSRVELLFLRPAAEQGTAAAYRAALVANLYGQMLNERLGDIARQANPPFAAARGGIRNLVRPTDVFSVAAVVADTGIRAGLSAAVTEVERIERHGFVASELERAKLRLLRAYERAFAERDNTESAALAGEYTRNFLQQEPIPGITRELELVRELLPGVGLDEVNRAAHEWLDRNEPVVVVNAPDKQGARMPSGESLLAVIEQTRIADIAPHRDQVSSAPLVPVELAEADIVEETRDAKHNVVTWTLTNGVRVLLKPTDFKADEVLLLAYSPGGSSLVPDSLLTTARLAADAVRSSGLGSFSAAELQKRLAGTVLQLRSYIDTYQEGLSGGSSPKDLKTLLELVYLHFYAPRADSAAFDALRSRVRTVLANRSASPAAAFYDTLDAILGGRHPRTRPLTAAAADSMDLARTLRVYRDRFADASDFTFVLVGSFSVDDVRPLVRRYLGNLPATHRDEAPRDLGIRPPPGRVEGEVRKGIEPQSQTQIVFTGPFEDSPLERLRMDMLAALLQMRLRDELREELGGTYGVGVSASVSLVPTSRYSLGFAFGSAPDRANELVQAVFAQIDSVRRAGATAAELAKIKETAMRERETELRDNRFWLSQLANADQSGEPLDALLNLGDMLGRLSGASIRESAERYLDVKRFVRVTLLPEKTAR